MSALDSSEQDLTVNLTPRDGGATCQMQQNGCRCGVRPRFRVTLAYCHGHNQREEHGHPWSPLAERAYARMCQDHAVHTALHWEAFESLEVLDGPGSPG